jgi:hypothetical protein
MKTRRPVNTESIEWLMEDQAFLGSYDSAARPPPLSRQQVGSLSQSPCVSRVELTDGGRKGWVRSQIIRLREGLALYKQFNNLSVSRSPKFVLIIRTKAHC